MSSSKKNAVPKVEAAATPAPDPEDPLWSWLIRPWRWTLLQKGFMCMLLCILLCGVSFHSRREDNPAAVILAFLAHGLLVAGLAWMAVRRWFRNGP